MKGWLAVAAGGLLLVIALALDAPAALLDARVAAATDGRVRIAGATGTLWNGMGELVLLPRGTRRLLAWHIDAASLLTGEARGTLALDGSAAQSAAFAFGHGRTALRNFDADLPMDALLETAGVPAALGAAGGSVATHVDRFVRTEDALDADLSVQWKDASLPAPASGVRIGLGDISVELRGSGPEIGGLLSNRGGDVDITGRLRLDAALHPSLDAALRPRAGIERDRADAIVAALSLVGAPDGQGGYRLNWPR